MGQAGSNWPVDVPVRSVSYGADNGDTMAVTTERMLFVEAVPADVGLFKQPQRTLVAGWEDYCVEPDSCTRGEIVPCNSARR